MTITYTTLTGEGEMIETGLSLSEAAHAVLTSDSREYDVREADGEFTIWSRQQVANRPWAATRFVSYEDDREAAEADLFLQVVSMERMRGHREAITDGQYREMLQQQIDDLQYEDDEAERTRLRGEIESVAPYDGKWPDEPDDEADATRLVQDAIPAILEFLGTVARMETATEFDDRTDGEGMSGDGAVDTVSNLIEIARELLAKAKGLS